MSHSDESFLAALSGLSKDQIQQAGQRYTPGMDPQAPNLRIESLFTAIVNVSCGADALARFHSILDAFSKAWKGAKNFSQRPSEIQELADGTQAFLEPMMERLRARDAEAGAEWSARLTGIESELLADVAHWRAEEAKLQQDAEDSGHSSAHNTIRHNINAIGQCLAIVRAEKEYIETPAFKVLFDPQLLVSGEWGTGKTHLLCDFTQHRINRGQATVLVLAKNFQGNVVEEICARIEAGCTAVGVFGRLEELANKAAERTVIILDGVNEGRRQEWRKSVSSLQDLVADRPGIGLIVSCRTPFEHLAIDRKSLENFHTVKHLGFDDQEFDAQAAFFQYYNLPLPEVPLLDREFSRPLTLKLICQSLQNLSGRKFAKGFAGIASGQKGMTYILESFVNRVGEPIENEYGLRAKGCWGLLKGSDQIADKRLAGFAPCMATNLRGYVRRSEADRIIAANYPVMSAAKRRQLLDILRTNGLIEEDAVWYSTNNGVKTRVVFRLPYQRFSDHLVARHLLKPPHLDVSSAETIRRSFTAKSPLAKIFRLSNHYSQQYEEPGWAQALITEFPERVGKHLSGKQRELFFVLPKRAQNLNAYFEPFIEGMFWRDPAAFTEGTEAIVNQYLNAGPREWEQIVDALAAVSTKPSHPYHTKRLYDYLALYPMPDRDLQWSEYLRRRDASPTIQRLLTWAEKLNAANMPQRSARELVVLLSLVLTTVVRSDRDLATKALVMIGERFPEVLFAHVVTSLEFNDPYLPERMLAAAYGTTLSLVDSKAASTFRPLLGDLAETLYRMMFGHGARNATHHTLMRDYALGIIQIAQRANCVVLPKTAGQNLAMPFQNTHSTFASDGTPDPAVKEAIGHAIQMDFGNYTIGRLIPNRANYDDKKPDYVQVRAKIERRIFDLGYRAERFKEAESEITNMWNARDQEKVDRYGKKYSWIAFFEMWGEREATRKLPDWRLGERTSDCGVDPSFPKRPPDWTPPIPELFGDTGVDTESWVKGGFTPKWDPLLVVPDINGHIGEWVLVEGYIRAADETNDREFSAFLRGLFVAPRDVCSFRAKYLAVEFPGNDQIPDGAHEHCLYAGEAGRRQNYVRHLLQRNGRYRRQIVEALDRYLNMRHVPGIRIEVPFIHFGWESYHSLHNTFSGFNLPAPSLLQRLGLASMNREIDFYDSMGRLGTVYREAGNDWKGDRHSLLYIRADLLRRYLKVTRQDLVWCNWGERDWLKKMEGHDVIRDPARHRIYQAHNHIHRSFSQWSAKNSKVV